MRYQHLGTAVVLLAGLLACSGERSEGEVAVEDTLSAAAAGPEETTLEAVGEGSITGEVRLTSAGEGSDLHVSVSGAPANTQLSARLHEGSCTAQTGEAVAYLSGMSADGSGRASSSTQLGQAPEALGDGFHVVLILSGRQGSQQEVLACARVPRPSGDR